MYYSFVDILISGVLALIMFGIGLSLTLSHFKAVFVTPRSLGYGMLSQMVALPLIAFVIAVFSDMAVPFKVGLIILAACPGGTTSGIIAYFFRGNVALSISFTSINSILTLFSIPFIVNLALEFFYGKGTSIHLSYIDTLVQIFIVTILPASLGVALRMRKPIIAAFLQKYLRGVLLAALAAVFVIKFFAGESSGGTGITMAEIYGILPYALLLNTACLSWGFFFGKVTKIGLRDAYTIAIESAVHNTTLAFLVAGTLLRDQDMVKPALIYSMFSFWTAIVFSFIIKWSHRQGYFTDFDK